MERLYDLTYTYISSIATIFISKVPRCGEYRYGGEGGKYLMVIQCDVYVVSAFMARVFVYNELT
jgi:hypothetical protein